MVWTGFDNWINDVSRRPFTWPVPKDHTALIVVDMQNAFCRSDSSLNQAAAQANPLADAVDGCVALVRAARAAGVMIIFTRYVYLPEYADGGLMRGLGMAGMAASGQLAYGTKDVELISEFDVTDTDLVIDKSRPSSFYGTRLDPLLTGAGIENLVICGVTTNICVQTTFTDAEARGYDTFVVADATAEFETSRQQHALYTMTGSGPLLKVADVAASWGVAA
jgi:ureidoacrylate peracid hydrolase